MVRGMFGFVRKKLEQIDQVSISVVCLTRLRKRAVPEVNMYNLECKQNLSKFELALWYILKFFSIS